MQSAWKYGLEILIVVMINLCVVGFVGAWYGVVGGNPYVKPPAVQQSASLVGYYL